MGSVIESTFISEVETVLECHLSQQIISSDNNTIEFKLESVATVWLCPVTVAFCIPLCYIYSILSLGAFTYRKP